MYSLLMKSRVSLLNILKPDAYCTLIKNCPKKDFLCQDKEKTCKLV